MTLVFLYFFLIFFFFSIKNELKELMTECIKYNILNVTVSIIIQKKINFI